MDVGFVTDGEWNSLRTTGTNRPVQLLQLIKNSKEKANIKAAELKEIFEPHLMGKEHGNYEHDNVAISAILNVYKLILFS